MDTKTLYAICWQDAHEPWGWAPVAETGGFGDVPTDLLPNGAFFWDEGEAQTALTRVLDWATGVAVENLRQQDNQRHQREVEDFEADEARGHPLPGVSVSVVGQVAPAWAPKQPRPLQTEDELHNSARRLAGNEWSIQHYQVPVPKT